MLSGRFTSEDDIGVHSASDAHAEEVEIEERCGLSRVLSSAELTSAPQVSVLVSIGKWQEAQGKARQCAGCACLLGFVRFFEQVAQM